MTKKCMGCGVDKDLDQPEISLHAEEDGLVSFPICPLMVLECSSPSGWRAAVVCHECFHRLEVDMWISDRCWASIDPTVPFDQLPDPRDDEEGDGRWNPLHYEVREGASS